MNCHNTLPASCTPRRIVFVNLRYRTACAYKLAVIGVLLFVAAWFILFSELSLGADLGLSNSDGDLLPLRTGNARGGEMVAAALETGSSRPPLDETKSATAQDHSPTENRGDHQVQVQVLPPRPACPRSVLLPNVSVYPKTSPAELYARLSEVPRHFSIEPPKLPGNLGLH